MSVRRVGRFMIGLVVSMVLLGALLPLAGVPKSHFLPPSWVYRKAEKVTSGRIVKVYSAQTDDPFMVGEHNYFVDYVFQAPIPAPDGSKSVIMQTYNGKVRLTHEVYHTAKVDQRVPVRYEKTYPWVNGVDVEGAGVGCGEGSDILSGWLIWVAVWILLAFIIAMILTHFGVQED